MNYTVFGAGAWGTAIAIHINNSKNPVTLVPRRSEHAQAISASNDNTDYLPGHSLSGINITSDLKESLNNTDVILLACPSHALRNLCSQLQPLLPPHSIKAIFTLCKGLDKETLLPPAAVVQEFFPNIPSGVLSGPNNAQEVASGKPAATTIALNNQDNLLKDIQTSLSSPSLRVYTSSDVTGVEFAGCLKNIYAIGAGICDGLNLGDNARAAYLTRALKELCSIGEALGGQSQTFLGLSGFGDLIATCYGPWSRNRTFGQKLSEGSNPQDFIKSQKTVVEGYWATNTFHNLLKNKNINAPILNELYNILYTNKNPNQALISLMTRELKPEIS